MGIALQLCGCISGSVTGIFASSFIPGNELVESTPYMCYSSGKLADLPIEDVIRQKLIPSITGGHVVNDKERKLLALPTRNGGLGLKIFTETAKEEYENSKKVTLDLQNKILGIRNTNSGKSRNQIKSARQKRQEERLQSLIQEMTDEER
eukprot:gene19779-21716_t